MTDRLFMVSLQQQARPGQTWCRDGDRWRPVVPPSCLLEREDVMLQDNKYIGTLRTEDIKCYIKTMRAVEITRTVVTVVTVGTQQLPAS